MKITKRQGIQIKLAPCGMCGGKNNPACERCRGRGQVPRYSVGDALAKLIDVRDSLAAALGKGTWARGSVAHHVHQAIVELHNAEVELAKRRE